MANIFDVTNERNNDVRQNPFDWSHQSNLTGRLGFIYPFFADLVPANTSFRCTPRLGLQFMPMMFPVQTRMKARVSFFRVPLRTLWKDYKDYIGNFKQGLVEPYLDLATSFEKFMGTGKLADYLNIPTVLVGKYSRAFSFTTDAGLRPVAFDNGADSCELSMNAIAISEPTSTDLNRFTSFNGAYYYLNVNTSGDKTFVEGETYSLYDIVSSDTAVLRFSPAFEDRILQFRVYFAQFDSGDNVLDYQSLSDSVPVSLQDGVAVLPLNLSELQVTIADTFSYAAFVFELSNPSDHQSSYYTPLYLNYSSDAGAALSGLFGQEASSAGYREIDRNTSPYFDSTSENKDRQLKLDAYTARAYEAIYNAYMRDNRNNPYYRNGQLEYNVWIPTDEGGADTYPYELHRANWEKDFLTTAVPSPQQGRAPLVGLTSYSTAEEVDGITKTALKLALVDEDGKRYALRFSSDESGVNGVDYAELGDGVAPQALSFRSLVDAASTGISIPDLRMVNAYQKFLELNMRKGYSYKEIVEGRFDCQVRYDDLNIPEFLGGFTRDVNMNRVVQSVERDPSTQYPAGSYANALGSLAGDAFLAAEGQPISCFCDEESVIMGLISIVPVPNYSQLLPKHYLYRDLLDHFQPEFDNLGFQPITYKEVCPIQAFNAGDDLNGTFGYQRAWYDLVQRTDQVHGLFRTQLRDFLMNRVFDAKPTLTKSFLLVDDEQLNDVFAVTETTDKFTGQIWMDCQVKLPVSRVSIPRLD